MSRDSKGSKALKVSLDKLAFKGLVVPKDPRGRQDRGARKDFRDHKVPQGHGGRRGARDKARI